ncbi:MAG: hypothetical protein ABIK33_05685 [candidate division WOR-3 bacterium]
MKTYKYIIKIVIMCAGFVFSCTKEPLPDHYGVFLVDNKKLIQLNTVETRREGYEIPDRPLEILTYSDVFGIRYIANIKVSNPKISLIAYNKVTPTYILYKLKYSPEPIYIGYGDYNCWWFPEKEIGLNISPIKQKPDMYRLTPSEPLSSGHYAICLGDFRYGQGWNFVIEEVIKSK